MKSKEFKIEIGSKFKDEKRDLEIIDRKYMQSQYYKNTKLKYYKYKCNKCEFECGEHWNIKNKCYDNELWVLESSLLRGQGCSCCSNKTVVKGINDIATTNPELVKYFVNTEDAYTHTFCSGEKVLMKCPYCETEKYMKISDLNNKGFSCPKCSDGISFPEKMMFCLLGQLNINFQTEYSPKWIKPKAYDFYIPSKNLIIEMDGGFHNKDNNMSGQSKEQSKELDDYKDKMALEHGLKVIRIDCDYKNIVNRFEFIKNNTINKLKDIFDLNSIDWDCVKEKSYNNRVKEVCDYWYLHNDINNENLTTPYISNIFNSNRTSVKNYLKIGSELGWCNYNPKEEIKKAKIKNSRSKEIIMFTKGGDKIGKFPSPTYIEKYSEKLFNIKLYASHIRSVCYGVRKNHKGFIFKYAKKES